ncbi:MAG TPA: CBS domain-containing protein [Anaerolineaceae bacterium]|nr:CBS domain-containing protein [Anaerolineaceae bacterium]
MLVGRRMTRTVITISPETDMEEALNLMHREHIRRVPVVDKHGTLVGIITEMELLQAAPSDATTLSKFEIRELMDKVKIESLMTKEVITVTEDTPLEEAAGIMIDNKIGGLPVVQGEKVVGIITETDLFKIFLEMLGARKEGIRVSTIIKDEPGKIADITKAIFNAGGNIVSLGTFMGPDSETAEMTLKVDGVSEVALLKALEPYVERILDMRHTHLV